jgi:ketosteroid isomerase-like protein
MSQENVEVVRAQLQAWNEGDMDALREWYDPDAMIVRVWRVGRSKSLRWAAIRRFACSLYVGGLRPAGRVARTPQITNGRRPQGPT